MNPQIYILIISIIVAIVLLLILVPKAKVIDAHVSFLFMQAQACLYGTLVSQFHLIIYPVRIAEKGYISNFAFEFVVFPAIAVMFNLNFPKTKTFLTKIIYIVLYPTILTFVEVYLEKETDLIKYNHWGWYWSWITMLITLSINFFYYNWFIKRINKE